MSEDDGSIIPEAVAAAATPPEGDGTAAAADASASTTAAAATVPAQDFSMYGEKGLNAGMVKLLGEGDELKGARFFLKKYEGADDPNAEVLKGLNNLQYIASQKAYIRPPDDAPDNVKEEFGKQMKLLNQTPESAEGYKYNVRPEGLAEEVPWNQEEANQYSEVLHKHNASPALAAELMELYKGGLEGIPAVVAQEEATHREAQIDILRNEHGVNAEKVIQEATNAASLLGVSPEETSRIAMTAAGVNFLANLKTMISSDILSTAKAAGSVNAGDGQSWSEKAMESSKLATEAMKANDTQAYNAHYADQVKYNKMAAAAKR